MPTLLKTETSSLRLRNICALIEQLPESAVSYQSRAVADQDWDVKLKRARRTGNFEGVKAPLVLWVILFYPGYGFVSKKSWKIVFGSNVQTGVGSTGLAGFLRVPKHYFQSMMRMSKPAVLRRLQRRIVWQRSHEARSRRIKKRDLNDMH